MALATSTTEPTPQRQLQGARRLVRLRAGPWSVVVLVTAALVALRLHATVDRYDEGAILQGAQRILHGETPYRDFFTVYAPGQFYAVAALFRLFGASVLVERLLDGVFRVLLATAVYGWMARLTNRRFALIPALVAGAAIACTGNAGYPTFAALAAALACGLCLDRRARARGGGWTAAAGVCVGLTALFRFDFAVYLLPAALGVLLLSAIGAGGNGPFSAYAAARRWLAATLPLLAGLAAIVGPAFALLLHAAPAAALRYDMLTYPTTTLQRVYGLPPPSLLGDLRALARLQPPLSAHDQLFHLLFYGPIVVLAVAALLLARQLRRDGRRAIDAVLLARAFLLLLGGALIRQEAGRFDEAHALSVALCALALLTPMLQRWRPWRPGAQLHAPATLLLAWAVLLYLTLPLSAVLGAAPPWTCRSAVAAAACADLDADEQQTITYLLANSSPDEPVFVANAQNQRGTVSDVALNMLAGRRSPTLYMQYEPGVSNTRVVQQQIRGAIDRAAVRVVVLVDTVAPDDPNGSSVASGVSLLDDYLRAHYHTVFTAGSYSVALRN